MLDMLTRDPVTRTARRAVETVYFLVLASAVYLLGLGEWATVAAGAAIFATALLWNRARNKVARSAPTDTDYDCVVPSWHFLLDPVVWIVCWLVGPLLAAAAPGTAAKIAGLVIVGCGVAQVLTWHECRFSKRCHEVRGGGW